MSRSDRFKAGYSPYAPPAASFGARDRRIDCLRGVAVLGISANHVLQEGAHSARFETYRFGHLFAFDFADVFILISGIVAGIVFFPLLLRHGAGACFRKSLRRAGQIWMVQLLCTLAALAIVLLFERGLGVTGSLLSPFDDPMGQAFAGNILLYSPSIFLDILPVYIMLLPLLPLAFVIFRWSVPAYFVLTGAVWSLLWIPVFLAGAGLPSIPLETLSSSYFIHPLSAQLLFFTGVAIGIRKREIEAVINRPNSFFVFGAIVFLIITNYMDQVTWMVHHFDQKQFAGPLRLAELLAVLVILSRLIGPQDIRSPRVGLVEACGRHTLPVFAVSTVGAFFFSYLTNWMEAGRLIYGLCMLANAGLCLTCGWLLERRGTTGVTAVAAAPARSAIPRVYPAELHST